MGNLPCFNSRDAAEKMILLKEETLKLQTFTILDIKNAFFALNEKTSITYENIIMGFKRLFQNFQLEADSELVKNLQILLKGLAEKKEEEDITKNSFIFKKLMIELYLLSKSKQKDKILMMKTKEKLNIDDVKTILKEIFETVMDCSLWLLICQMNEGKQIIEEKKFKIYKGQIDIVVEKLIKQFFIDETEKNPFELSQIFEKFQKQEVFDAMTTNGKILKFACLEQEVIKSTDKENNNLSQPEQEIKKELESTETK